MAATTCKLREVFHAISYRDGFIGNLQTVEDSDAEVDAIGDDYEIVSTGLLGWGDANAVIISNGCHYFARVS